MHTIVRDHKTKASKEILEEHFGEHYDIKAIKKSVALLRTGKVNVGVISDASIPEHIYALANIPQRIIKFGPCFHSAERTTQDAASGLLHEATHTIYIENRGSL